MRGAPLAAELVSSIGGLTFSGSVQLASTVSKKLGSDVWIPIQMMSWSAVAISQMALNGRTSFYITRCLLGLIEGGFIADTILFVVLVER